MALLTVLASSPGRCRHARVCARAALADAAHAIGHRGRLRQQPQGGAARRSSSPKKSNARRARRSRAKQQEAAAERALLRAAEERDAVQILRRMGRAGLLPDGEATTLALAAVSSRGCCCRWAGCGARRARRRRSSRRSRRRASCARRRLREWPSVLEWWPMARGVAADDHTECEDAAVRAALALGKFAEAHALLEAAEAAGALRRQPLRRTAAACARVARGDDARRCLELALRGDLADSNLVRDVLPGVRGCFGARRGGRRNRGAARGGARRRRRWRGARAAGGGAAARRPQRQRCNALGLKAVRGAGAALRLRPSDLEAALLCCARAGAWRQARWLTRAALAEPARSTLGGATLALAACARGDGVAFGRRRRALARSGEAAARSAEGDVFGLPSADGDDPRVALWRGVCPSAVAWAPRVLESRLQALQGSASIGDARRAAAAAAAEARAGGIVPAWLLRGTLLDAAAQPGMAREASALFDIYDAEADPQLSVQMLQCFESLGDWRAALALPAAAPSAATFTAALTHCSPRRWSIVAEARGGSRAERRAAALRRWLDGARARRNGRRAGRRARGAPRRRGVTPRV